MMKEENHVFQGIRRDNHPIKLDGKFLWDARNIRITNREDNTLLSITNEKGTSDPLIEFQGYYVGHCVLGKYLVVFTANDDSSDNYIYRVDKVGNKYRTVILFHEEDAWEHSWSPSSPIEAIGIYETELVQKVYWIDDNNQPRFINIVLPELKIPEEDHTRVIVDGVNFSLPRLSTNQEVVLYLEHYFPNGLFSRTSFDFVSTLKLLEKVEVRKLQGEGSFAPGVILYAFSYYNLYGGESNLFYVTPIQYISPVDRGASPEEKVTNSFKIKIDSLDRLFDYLRVYSIHRTSLDSVPTVTRVTDVPVSDDTIIVIDKGTTGDIVDPTQLLFIGGKSVIAKAITHKDNTLFLGNISLLEDKDWDEVLTKVKDWVDDEAWSTDVAIRDSVTNFTDAAYYSYSNNLSSQGVFKMGETYRCGIQLQKANGNWSNPIFLEDRVLTTSFPQSSSKSVVNTSSEVTLNGLLVDYLKSKGYLKVRACVVFPTLTDRTVLCLGVLCPTVFNAQARVTNSPYAQSSWFFRPSIKNDSINNNSAERIYSGADIQFQHNRPLFYGGDRGAEVQSMIMPENSSTFSDISDPDKFSSSYFVDENLVTFHSPDIEFDSALSDLGIYEGTYLNIIGAVSLGATIGDIDIQTSTPVASSKASGFKHLYIGYPIGSSYKSTGGLVSGLFYKDSIIKTDFGSDFNDKAAGWNFLVYPWHREGSLNNDTNRESTEKTRSSVLGKKKLSNLKFFGTSSGFSSSYRYDITTPLPFNSNEVSLLKPKIDYLNKLLPYYGNVDSLVTAGDDYPLFYGHSFVTSPSAILEDSFIKTSREPVRMKYKSSPHLVFSLKGDDKEIQLLPRLGDVETLDGETYSPPVWSDASDTPTTGDVSSSGKFYYIIKRALLRTINPGTNVGTYCYCPDAKLLFYGALPESLWEDKNTVIPCWSNVTTKMDGAIIRLEGGDNFISTPIPGVLEPNSISKFSYEGPTKYYKVVVSGDTCDLVPYVPSETLIHEETLAVPTSNSTFTLRQAKLNNFIPSAPYLLLGEIVRDYVTNRFGGNSEEALRSNLWLPASEPVSLNDPGDEGEVTILYKYGDTWYSRYDCLKTYPFTQEDKNQVVEIGSFMCETRVNIDGRYDKNRGQMSNLAMTPQNFNLLNEVYSLKDNFFNYRILSENYYKQHTFANQITWSKEKHAGEEVDTWTNITLANTLDMDGEKGKVIALKTWNEHLLCFQEKAFSQILFNSRVQIPTTDGVPIEISNGYKVNGSRLFSGNIGCSNKWAIATTTTGVYFLDSNTDGLYVFNGQIANLSEDRGMNWWIRQSHTNKVWRPIPYNSRALNGIRAFYDTNYGDIYFTPGPVEDINQPDALCYSEQLGQFTSFMSYGGTQAMFNFTDGFYSLRETNGNVKLYLNNVGDYNNFYGDPLSFSITFIANGDPTYTKIFDTVELRADSYSNEMITNKEPFSSIKAENEYQSGINRFKDNPGSIRKKFRVWRINIPRSSEVASRKVVGLDVSRKKLGRARMRNPWTRIVLTNDEKDNSKVVLHDLTVKYTI